jgi:hypothetical protein
MWGNSRKGGDRNSRSCTATTVHAAQDSAFFLLPHVFCFLFFVFFAGLWLLLGVLSWKLLLAHHPIVMSHSLCEAGSLGLLF